MANDRLKRKIPTCEDHAPTGCRYVESMVDGERRTAAGERQHVCGECGLWAWPRSKGEC